MIDSGGADSTTITAIIAGVLTLIGMFGTAIKLVWDRWCKKADRIEQRFEIHISKLETKLDNCEEKHAECEERDRKNSETHQKTFLELTSRLCSLEAFIK